MAQLMPLPLTVSCFSIIQIGFAFLVPAHPGSPGQRAVKQMCVCVCVCVCVMSKYNVICLTLTISFLVFQHVYNARILHLQQVRSIKVSFDTAPSHIKSLQLNNVDDLTELVIKEINHSTLLSTSTPRSFH